MTHQFPFKDGKPLFPITQSELDAFNMERFQFARDRVAKPTSTFEAVRDASLRLLEMAMGERKNDLPKITDTVLERYTRSNHSHSVW